MIDINISSHNALPYIELEHPRIELLIDTGSSRSILRPTVAEKYYPNCIYRSSNTIKTALGSEETQFEANIPAFSEFSKDNKINFILFDFHDFFDGVIGLIDLIKMKLNIDLVNQTLKCQNFEIPFKYRKPSETNFSITINPNE